MKIAIPDVCLVAVIGSSPSDGPAFARRFFAPGEITDLDGAQDRLVQRRLAVIPDAIQRDDRTALVTLAKRHYAKPVAIVLETGSTAHDPDRLAKDGFRQVVILKSQSEIETAQVVREKLEVDRREERGPFDLIGDVHGCADELIEVLDRLGYRVGLTGDGDTRRVSLPPSIGRRVIFVGDLVDRGPRSPDVLRIVMAMCAAGQAMCVPGNHDAKFLRWLHGRNVKPTHGLDRTIAQMEAEPHAFRGEVAQFLDHLASHLWLDGGALAVAHAGIRDEMIGRSAAEVREFCLYGETSGETDQIGLPIRYHWAAHYEGATAVVYGHTPVPAAEWLNNTLCIDTGCCFGGSLTAVRWPERDTVSVPARQVYAEPRRPFGHPPVRPRQP